MKEIRNQNFPNERDLYGVDGIHLIDCSFDGVIDGESALKEAKNIKLEHCLMNLRYPLWHDKNVELLNVIMTDKCRAALWYSDNIKIDNSQLLGIKALRECKNIAITNTKIVSPEFGWRSHDIVLENSLLESEYLFFQATNLKLNKIEFTGKYSFQYAEDLVIENSILNTKDAFWHTKNVTVKNSIIKGEYLAWYSENLVLENCKIIGTQPFCYCQGLKLINCEMENADLSFEYSDVIADIKGNILSVKNPRSGKIIANSITDIIYTDDRVYESTCEIEIKDKGRNL